ncbi:MAG: ATP-binding cassette domain-containing protein [Bdellovibrionales bacterium]|nr:ATP-binding cassette domain-containing protein [Bdellovibrionales bacterium]
MIEVSQLTRKYGNFTAVDNVSFEIPKGEIVGLLGHNGAGKTTIMKVLTGYLEPTSGSVTIAGTDITVDRIAVQKRIGYLPENAPLYPDMSVVQYLEYVAELRGLEEDVRARSIREVIDKTALREKAHAQIDTLSKGYKQRVGVAQAILHKPEILILDEPTNGLDPSQIEDMRDLIRELSKNSTVILSTHIMQEVQALCARVIVMLQGKIATDSKLSDLQTSNRLVVSLNQKEEVVSSELRKVKGVARVKRDVASNGHQNYVLDLNVRSDEVSPLVAKLVVEKGWDLYNLYPEQRDLEAIFRDISKTGGSSPASSSN